MTVLSLGRIGGGRGGQRQETDVDIVVIVAPVLDLLLLARRYCRLGGGAAGPAGRFAAEGARDGPPEVDGGRRESDEGVLLLVVVAVGVGVADGRGLLLDPHGTMDGLGGGTMNGSSSTSRDSWLAGLAIALVVGWVDASLAAVNHAEDGISVRLSGLEGRVDDGRGPGRLGGAAELVVVFGGGGSLGLLLLLLLLAAEAHLVGQEAAAPRGGGVCGTYVFNIVFVGGYFRGV